MEQLRVSKGSKLSTLYHFFLRNAHAITLCTTLAKLMLSHFAQHLQTSYSPILLKSTCQLSALFGMLYLPFSQVLILNNSGGYTSATIGRPKPGWSNPENPHHDGTAPWQWPATSPSWYDWDDSRHDRNCSGLRHWNYQSVSNLHLLDGPSSQSDSNTPCCKFLERYLWNTNLLGTLSSQLKHTSLICWNNAHHK